MTLAVQDNLMPAIRTPNFEDLTFDAPIESIPLVAGNEKGEVLKTVTLKEYLEHFDKYLHGRDKVPSLLCERDTHVLMSAQACFLPLSEEGKAKFNAALYNYQSTQSSPAVLAITAVAAGTSAQVVNEYGRYGQKLYFNKDGERCSFLAQRPTADRAARGVATQGSMTEAEQQQNMILIIQVPLKIPEPPRRAGYMYAAKCLESCADFETLGCMNECVQEQGAMMRDDTEDAIVSIGEPEGIFEELKGMKIERETNFPVRVTLQFYKGTSTGVVEDKTMAEIAKQLTNVRNRKGEFFGSLVVAGQTRRPTEAKSLPSEMEWQPTPAAPWWEMFWATHGSMFPHLTKAGAERLIFVDKQWANTGMSEAQVSVLALLQGAEAEAAKKQQLPPWKV